MNKKNILIMALALVLVAAISVGGTIAWLADTTQTVTNTFSPTNIDLTLTETDATPDEGNQTKAYTVVPGVNMPKDPKVSASSDVDYFVFVKVDAAGWDVTEAGEEETSYHTYKTLQDKLSCSITADWKFVAKEGTSYIYYQAVESTETFEDVQVLVDNTVYVDNTLTDEMMNPEVNGVVNPVTIPSLTFTAYAIQQANGYESTFQPAAAWAAAKAN